jgi:multidrug transporter EmrE-like cation transporter
MNILLLVLIIFEVFLNVAAQITLKVGMDRIGHFEFSWINAAPTFLQVALSPWIWLGIAIYVVSLVIWLAVLSRAEVSIAYPMTSLGYVLNALAAYYIVGEHLSFARVVGILIIVFGVIVLARS